MTITTPSTVQISTASQLWLPALAAQPLQRALQNVNYLMQYHRPALVDLCYTAEAQLTRSAVYIVPIIPSADGLRYTMVHRLVCSAASQSVTVTVDYSATYAGGSTTWTNIYSQGITSSGSAGALTTHTKADQTIPAAATVLRVTYTAPASGNRTDHHLLVYPSPGAPAAGITTAGAVPFDDGLISDADKAAIHTEWINRCKRTAVAVLTDRKQCALSFAQDESSQLHTWSTLGTGFYALPPGRVWLPHQSGPVTLAIRAIGKVSAGSTSDRIRVRQIGYLGSVSATLDADETTQSATLAVQVQNPGPMGYADLEIAVSRVGANTSRLLACMAYYTPGT